MQILTLHYVIQMKMSHCINQFKNAVLCKTIKTANLAIEPHLMHELNEQVGLMDSKKYRNLGEQLFIKELN